MHGRSQPMITATEKCPWCGSQISRDKFEEITNKIRDQEKKKLVQRETEIRKECQTQYQIQLEQDKKKAVAAEKLASSAKIKELTETVTKLQTQEGERKKK